MTWFPLRYCWHQRLLGLDLGPFQLQLRPVFQNSLQSHLLPTKVMPSDRLSQLDLQSCRSCFYIVEGKGTQDISSSGPHTEGDVVLPRLLLGLCLRATCEETQVWEGGAASPSSCLPQFPGVEKDRLHGLSLLSGFPLYTYSSLISSTEPGLL